MVRNWVLATKFKELTGITPESVRSRLNRGEWLLACAHNPKGFVTKIGKYYYIDVIGYNNWIDQQLSEIANHG